MEILGKSELFVANILKSLALTQSGKKTDMPVGDLQEYVTKADVATIRGDLRNGLVRNLKNDLNGNNIFRQEIKVHYTAAKQLLADNKILEGTDVSNDELLRIVAGTNLDNVVDTMLLGAVEGLPEQRITDKTADNTAQAINTIFEDGYTEMLANHQPPLTEEQFPLHLYKEYQTRSRIIVDLTNRLGGDQNRAMQILNSPVKAEDNKFLANNGHLQSDFEAARLRNNAVASALNENEHDGLTVMDLMLGFSQMATRAQVMAFCDSRTDEQDKMNESGDKISRDDPTRLGNVLGDNGRKTMEAVIGGKVSNKVNPMTHAANRPALPEHKWRGYKKLAARIKNTVTKMYGAIQTVGFVERLLGKKEVPTVEVENSYQWAIQYERMPDGYRDQNGNLNHAGDFFNRMKARIIGDQIRVTKYQTMVKNDPLGKDPDSRLKLQYYEARVAACQSALDQLAKKMKDENGAVPDNAYFAKLVGNAVYLRDTKLGQDAKFMNSNAIAQELKATRLSTPASEMQGALQTFAQFEQSTDPKEKAASYKMLADLFSIRDKFDAGKIEASELDDLMHNIPNSPFNPRMVNDLISGLSKPANDPNRISVEECRVKLHHAAEKYLKEHKYEKTYTNRVLNAKAATEMKNIDINM